MFTALLLILWLYRGIVTPLGRMKIATQNIKDGNLDFELEIPNGTPIFEEYKTDKAYGVYPFSAVMVTAENFEEIMGEDAK